MNGLSHKTVVITGALGGIAKATIRTLDAYQMNFVLIDRVDEDTEFLNSLQSQAHYFKADLASTDSFDELQSGITALYPEVDIIIHAAGLYQYIALADLSYAQWNRQININLNANYYLIKCLLPYLSEHSAIVNIASISGYQGSIAHTAYSTAKGAIVALTKSLALELAPRTRVNTVSPGLIDTVMIYRGMSDEKRAAYIEATPLKRLGQPEEIAQVIKFLCSSDASFITGENIHVNGGLYRD